MTDQEQWRVGATSARFESATGDPGAVSLGRGDHGGASYGTYQLATGPGTLQKYLRQSRFGEQFKDLEPGTPAFNNKWREVAAEQPAFGADQHDFIKRTHVDPAISIAGSKFVPTVTSARRPLKPSLLSSDLSG